MLMLSILGNTHAQDICFTDVFSMVGVVFCEGGNKGMRIWQRVHLECTKTVSARCCILH